MTLFRACAAGSGIVVGGDTVSVGPLQYHIEENRKQQKFPRPASGGIMCVHTVAYRRFEVYI